MSRVPYFLIAGAALAAAPAAAADNYFSGQLDLRAGYGANPFLRSPSQGGSVLLGGTLLASLNSRTARSLTTLSGTADVSQNLQHYGRNENYLAQLTRQQTFSDRINGSLGVRYSSTINPGQLSGFDTGGLDLLTIGQRTETYGVDASAGWKLSSVDALSATGNASHVRFGNLGSDYDQYGGSLGYTRTLSARTSAGFNLLGNVVESDVYGRTSSINASAQLSHQLSQTWSFNGSVGVIFPDGRTTGGNPTLGFSAQLCGKYTRKNICFNASRQSTPSGIGGLRNNLTFGATLDYQLDERQTLNASASYSRSDAGGGVLAIPRQEFYQASGGYARQITQRVSVGASGRYQRRDYGPLGSASSYAITVDITTKLGRLSS